MESVCMTVCVCVSFQLLSFIKSGGFLAAPGRTFRALILTFRSVWYLRKCCATPSVLHPLHCSCCQVKTVSLSPFGVWDWPILILQVVILRITLLIVVVAICPGLVHVGSRVPVSLSLGILLMTSVSLVNHWLKLLWRFNFVLFLSMLLEFSNHVFWTW
jgi:hypothetical protein